MFLREKKKIVGGSLGSYLLKKPMKYFLNFKKTILLLKKLTFKQFLLENITNYAKRKSPTTICPKVAHNLLSMLIFQI